LLIAAHRFRRKDSVPATARRAREKQQRYDEIVDAAESIFFSKGYNSASMDEIANAAQISRPLLYVYFKDKAAIMRAVMLRAAQSMVTRFADAKACGEDGMQQIKGIGRAYYQFSVDESDYFDVMTNMATFPMPEEADDAMVGMLKCREQVHAMMVEALNDGIKDGTIDPEQVHDPSLTAQILRGSLHGVIMSVRQPKDASFETVDSGMMVNEAIDMMCYGMRTS
jgi:AcrR family transcriptional regulator